jgi:rhodanese-related sulfurtransferase
MIPGITREELKQKIERGDRFILVETLHPDTYRQGHLRGAINIPPGEVVRRAPQMLPDKKAEIVVYCKSPT